MKKIPKLQDDFFFKKKVLKYSNHIVAPKLISFMFLEMMMKQYFENLTLLLPEAANICTAGTHLYSAQTKPISC